MRLLRRTFQHVHSTGPSLIIEYPPEYATECGVCSIGVHPALQGGIHMKTRVLRACLHALACNTVLALAVPSMAADVNLKADLKGSSDVTPVATKGTGSVTVYFDTAC